GVERDARAERAAADLDALTTNAHRRARRLHAPADLDRVAVHDREVRGRVERQPHRGSRRRGRPVAAAGEPDGGEEDEQRATAAGHPTARRAVHGWYV